MPDRIPPVHEHDLPAPAGRRVEDQGCAEIGGGRPDVPVGHSDQAIEQRVAGLGQVELGQQGCGKPGCVRRDVRGRRHHQEPRPVGRHRLQPAQQAGRLGGHEHVVAVPREAGQWLGQCHGPDAGDGRGRGCDVRCCRARTSAAGAGAGAGRTAVISGGSPGESAAAPWRSRRGRPRSRPAASAVA